MSESIQEMENRWALLVSAKDQRTGVRITDTDAKYARECMALRVQIEERKKAEASGPQINPQQLAWLNRLAGATDKNGQPLIKPGDPKTAETARRLFNMRIRHANGEDLSAEMAQTEANFTAAGAKLGPEFAGPTTQQRQVGHEVGMNFGPPVNGSPGAGAINTQILEHK